MIDFGTFTDADLDTALANAKFHLDWWRKEADTARIRAMTAQVTLDAAMAEKSKLAAREGGAK